MKFIIVSYLALGIVNQSFRHQKTNKQTKQNKKGKRKKRGKKEETHIWFVLELNLCSKIQQQQNKFIKFQFANDSGQMNVFNTLLVQEKVQLLSIVRLSDTHISKGCVVLENQ